MNGRRSRMVRRGLALALTAKPAALGMAALSPRIASAATVNCDVNELKLAIVAANAATTPTTLSLATGCTYVLTAADGTSADGLPAIAKTVTIEGNGDTITRSTATNTPAFRILHVASGGNLTVNKLTVSNGRSDSTGGSRGGGIYNQGTLSVLSSTISGNQVTGPGTGVLGGGIRSTGPLTVVDSVISGNSASADATATAGNNARALGGGISVKGTTVTIRNSSVTGNTVSAVTGGAQLATATARGGGIHIENSGSGTVPDQVIIRDTTVAANRVTGSNLAGGGVSAKGGGISFDGGFGGPIQGQVVNSTIANNRLEVPSGSANPRPEEGGIGGAAISASSFVFSGTASDSLKLVNTTIAGNTSPTGSGALYLTGSGSLTLTNSILASNFPNCQGTVTDGGKNITFPASDTSCRPATGPDTFLHGDPMLAALPNTADVPGGQTRTMALRSGSAAIDTASSTVCQAAVPGGAGGLDQRGLPRSEVTGDTLCDIGAYEVQPVVFVPSPAPSPTSDANPAATAAPSTPALPKAGGAGSGEGLPWPLLPVALAAAGGVVAARRHARQAAGD